MAGPDRLGRDRADDAGVRVGGAERRAGPAGVRPADGAGPAGRPREGRLAVRLRLLLGTAASARQGDRAGAARARLDAVRAPHRLRRPSRAPLRLRAHDLTARVRPHDRPRPAPPRRSLGGRRPRRLDVRAAPPRVPDAAAAPPRRAARAAPPRRRRPRRLRQRAGGGRPSRARHRRPGRDRERLGPRRGSGPRGTGRGDGPARVRTDHTPLHRPVRQLRPRPGAVGDRARPARRRLARAGRQARGRDRRAAAARASGRCSSAGSSSRSR